MKTEVKGLEFDPGFAPYILAFRGTVEYLYMDINKIKNLSHRKMKLLSIIHLSEPTRHILE